MVTISPRLFGFILLPAAGVRTCRSTHATAVISRCWRRRLFLSSSRPLCTTIWLSGRLSENPMGGIERRLLSFGLLTDVQYADRDDHRSWYAAHKMRYYRSSLEQVRRALSHWTDEGVAFVLQLGDLVDASNRTMGLNPELAFQRALDVFAHFDLPTYHVMGNHELDNFPRSQLAKYDWIKGAGAQLYYYCFSPVDKVSVIVLDCFEVSLLGHQHTHPNYLKALRTLQQYHTSNDQAEWELDHHLTESEKRFVSYNGAVSSEQMDWLEEQLCRADANGHRVIMCGHLALLASSSHWTCVCWNGEAVLDIVHRHRCVVAYLSGHLHDTGYDVDTHGVHHVTLGGMIEVPPEETSFSTVHLYADRMEIAGFGREKSYVLPYHNELRTGERNN